MRFDRFGRVVDEDGQVLDIKPIVHSTLKVNINREREEKLKQVNFVTKVISPFLSFMLLGLLFPLKVSFQTRVDRSLKNPEANPWFDPSMIGGGGRVRDITIIIIIFFFLLLM